MNHDAVAEFSKINAMVMPRSSSVLPEWLLPWAGLDPASGGLARPVPWDVIGRHCDSPQTVIEFLGQPHSTGETVEDGVVWQYVRYILPSWPHLFVSFRWKERVINWWRFEQIETLCFSTPLRGDCVRVGVWTQSALERLAESYSTADLWDQYEVLRMQMADGTYKATFAAGLLVSWEKE
jgi:hypothetical protein